MRIREKDKQALVQIFSTVSVPIEVWAYGSRVNGTAHDGSDLDLVVRSRGLTAMSVNAFGELYEKIKDSNIPILVELRNWAFLPDSFHKNIEKQYEVLFDNRSSYDK